MSKTRDNRAEYVVSTLVSGSESKLETRITAVADLYKTRKLAADQAGVSTDQLARYMRGENQPSLTVAGRLCKGVGVSLEWLATGEGEMYVSAQNKPPPAKLDLHRLDTAIRVIEDYLESHDLEMKSEKKALAIEMLYERFADWGNDPGVVAQLMRLAS